MDLRKFDTTQSAEEGAELVLRNPLNDEEMIDEDSKEKVTISLLGADAAEYRDAGHDQQSARIRRSSARGRVAFTGQELDADALTLLVKATKGWKYLKEGDTMVDFNEFNARRIYTDYPWIREQVEAFINDRGNFLGN